MAGQLSTHRYTTWIDFYGKLLEEDDSDTRVPNSVYDNLVSDYLNDEEKFLNAVLENPKLNFILVPSTDKGHAHGLHHCSVYEDDLSGSQVVIGVHGS